MIADTPNMIATVQIYIKQMKDKDVKIRLPQTLQENFQLIEAYRHASARLKEMNATTTKL